MGIGFFGKNNGNHRGCFKSVKTPHTDGKKKKFFKFPSGITKRDRVNKMVSSARSFRPMETSPKLGNTT